MKELKEISSKYAMERSNDLFSQLVAKAYADGYCQGYKDRENEIPVDLRDNKTEFVDLGLPSGTLWSCDFKKEKENNVYIPYEEALRCEIPTMEQCNELFTNCRFLKKDEIFYCVGPNGKQVTFSKTGYKRIEQETLSYTMACLFWIRNENETMNNVARLVERRSGVEGDSYKEFSGYKIPIRLVQNKKQLL